MVEKQIDRLRKEVDDRISSNNTLWRAGLAGIGALILLKENLELGRFVLLLPILAMAFASHWLNQLLTLYRSGDSMAACECKINKLAGDVLLEHETILTRNRRTMLGMRRTAILVVAVLATGAYWLAVWHVRPFASTSPALLLWQTSVAAAALVNVVAAANLWRFLGYTWPSLRAAEAKSAASAGEGSG